MKEFFHPTLAKILLTIIFTLFVPQVFQYDTGIRCITTPCPSDAEGSILQYLIHEPFSHIYSVYWMNVVLGVFASYILSCAIITIYYKSLKK